MLVRDILKNKKVIFFDVGYTLDYPASGKNGWRRQPYNDIIQLTIMNFVKIHCNIVCKIQAVLLGL